MNRFVLTVIVLLVVVGSFVTDCFGQETLPAPPVVAVASSPLNPAPLTVKAKIGGFRISTHYNSGEGGNFTRETSEFEIESPDLQPALGFVRQEGDRYDAQIAGVTEKMLVKPFTHIETRVQTVVVQQPCPQPAPVPWCYGYGRRNSSYCCGITRNCGPALVAPAPVVPVVAPVPLPTPVISPASCYCRGVGCSRCRHAGVVTTSATTVYGRCVAWTRVTRHIAVYQDPPHGRQFWCDCASHRAAVARMYGYDAVWELVPCMCPEGCATCGGAGHCGH